MCQQNGGEESDCDARRWEQPFQAQPRSRSISPRALLLAELSREIASKEGREPYFRGSAQQIPQFLIVFALHLLRRLNRLAGEKLREGGTY